MSGINLYFLVFAVINLVLLYSLYRAWRTHQKSWQGNRRLWQIILLVFSAILLLIASAILAGMIYFNWTSWRMALNPDTPAPFFEFIWIFAVLGYGVCVAFANAVQAFVRGDYDQLIP